MAWLSIQQDLNDIVRFVHSDNPEEAECLGYEEFIKYVAVNSSIINYQDFIRQLNTFFPIFLDLETGEWEIFQIDQEEVSYSELIKLNQETEEELTLSARLWQAKKKKTFGKRNDYGNRNRLF